MLPKTNRLRQRKDLEQVFQKGARIGAEYVSLVVLKNPGQETRFAIFLKSGLFKKATKRNYWKRQLREATRKIALLAPQNYDIIIILKSAPKPGMTSTDFAQEISAALKKKNIP